MLFEPFQNFSVRKPPARVPRTPLPCTRNKGCSRRQQIQVITRIHIRLVPRADLARDQRRVTTGAGHHIPASTELRRFLNGVVVLFVDAFFAVLAVGFDVVFVVGRGQGEVAPGVGGEVAFGLGGAGNDVDDDALFHPHDIVGQGRDLFGRQSYAHEQVQRGFAGQGVIHQITELLVIVVQPVGEKALAGLGQYGVADQIRVVSIRYLCGRSLSTDLVCG